MGWNDAYWTDRSDRATQALQHHKQMMREHFLQIQQSVSDTVIYNQKCNHGNVKGNSKIIVDNIDTVSAIFKHWTPGKKTIVLNFASYKNPGGAFLKGSSAQEESLCHESTLYEVLSDPHLAGFYKWNNEHKNKSLYTNRALFSPKVLFIKDKTQIYADVLTVAAPNRKAYMGYIRGAIELDNLVALEERIEFISDIISVQQNVGTIILGAFGCGVFGQDPTRVAKMFSEKMKNAPADKVVYAIIDKGSHSKEGAYKIFRDVFSGNQQ